MISLGRAPEASPKASERWPDESARRTKKLDLYNAQVFGVSALAGLTSLKSLNLQGTAVTDVLAVKELVARGLKIRGLKPGHIAEAPARLAG